MYIRQQPVPKPVQEVKDKTFLAVEESEAEEIAIGEVDERPDV